jgi:hypothetical protein
VRAAVIWSTEHDSGVLALRILMALAIHGLRIEASVSAWAAAIMEAASPDEERYPIALSTAAWRLLRDGDIDGADRLGREALAASNLDSPLSIAVRCSVYTTTTAIEIYAGRTDIEQAHDWVACARRIGDLYEEALANTMVGVHRMFGGTDDAGAAAEEGVRVARRRGNPSALAYSLLTYGQIVGFDDLARGIASLDEAIDWANAAENEWAASAAAASRGSIVAHWGDTPEGCRAWLESATGAIRAGNRTSMAQALWGVAGYLALAGHVEPAAVLDGPVGRAGGFGAMTGFGRFDEALAALAALPARLGQERYAALVAQGMAMSDEQLLEFATAAVDGMVASADTTS